MVKTTLVCDECGKEKEFEFISEGGQVVASNPPLLCECGSETFRGKFPADPTTWVGSVGTNGASEAEKASAEEANNNKAS